jgi:hypothetical protein
LTLPRSAGSTRTWEVRPTALPLIVGWCASCSANRRYYCSGKFRVNAQGKLLDVWLIYRCEECDRSLKVEVVERANRRAIPAADYESYLRNDPTMVRRVAFDGDALRRLGHKVDFDVPFEVEGETIDVVNEEAETVTVQLSFDVPTQVRLDRLLSRQLGLSRRLAGLALSHRAIVVEGARTPRRRLSKPMIICLDIARLKAMISSTKNSSDA